jgi:hypothetical protein
VVNVMIALELVRVTAAIRTGAAYELPAIRSVYSRACAALALAASIAWLVTYGEGCARAARRRSCARFLCSHL